jgi:hypothetical protein
MAQGDKSKEKMKLKVLRIEDAVSPKSQKAYYKVYVEGWQSYFSCWSSKIKDYVGKEQEFEVTKQEMAGTTGPWFAYTISLPGEGNFQKSGSGGRSYGGQDPEITAKNTILMQLVELWKVGAMTNAAPSSHDGVKFVIENMDRVWAAYKYQTSQPQAPGEATGPKSEHPKHVDVLISEFRQTKTVSEASTYWNSNMGSIKVLSNENKQKLFHAKDEHLDCLRAPVETGEESIPF